MKKSTKISPTIRIRSLLSVACRSEAKGTSVRAMASEPRGVGRFLGLGTDRLVERIFRTRKSPGSGSKVDDTTGPGGQAQVTHR